jgi:tetratricopeptide (TPR) repeat protein
MNTRAARSTLFDFGPAVLLGAAPFVFLRSGGEFENYPKMLFLQWGIAVLALLWLARSGESAALRRRPTALDIAVLLFGACCGLSLFWAPSPARAVVPLLQTAAAVLLYFLLSRAPHPRRTARSIIIAAAVSSGLVALLGLLQYFFDLQWVPQAQSPASTFSNRNMAAHFVVICLPLAFAAFLETRRLSARLAALAGLLGSVAFLYVTATRAAWLAMIVVVFLLLAAGALRVGQARRSIQIVSIVLLVTGVLLVGSLAGKLAALDDSDSASSGWLLKARTGTVELRLIYWKNTLAMAADHFPLGVGLGQFAVAYPRYHRAAAIDWTFGEEFQLERAHNDHLEILAELGPVGFGAWVAILLLFFGLWRRVACDGEPDDARRAGFLGLSVVAFLVVATFSFPMERALPPIYFFACVGLMAALAPASRETTGAGAVARYAKPLRVGLALLMVAYIVASGYGMRRAILSHAERARALEVLAQGRVDAAAVHLARARELALGDPAPALLIARGLAAEGRYDSVVPELQHVLQMHPNQVNAMLNLGYAKLQLGRYEESRNYFERALEILPGSLTAHSNLGLIEFRLRQYDEAIRYYRRVLELAAEKKHYGTRERTDRQILVAHLQLGGAYSATGDVEAAIRHYERALRSNPDLVQVRQALEGLYGRRNADAPPVE